MELIDRGALIKASKDRFGTHCYEISLDHCSHYESCLECVAYSTPAIDAVEVVRCKDCICRAENKEKGYQYCMFAGWLIKDDDFCSHAERLDEEVSDGTD